MRFLAVIWVLILAVWCDPVLAENTVKLDKQGKTIIEAKSEKLKVKVTLTSLSVKSKPDSEPPYDDRLSCIKKIEIISNKKKIFVPKSVYLDICDASEAEIVFEKKEAILKIYGGDASTSFEVHVHFNSKMVSRRAYYYGELPDKPLEETRYWQREL